MLDWKFLSTQQRRIATLAIAVWATFAIGYLLALALTEVQSSLGTNLQAIAVMAFTLGTILNPAAIRGTTEALSLAAAPPPTRRLYLTATVALALSLLLNFFWGSAA